MKSGFVSVIGRTNAGKSTLINSLLEEKITLVSRKQNATRRKIKAIVMNDENQIIFIDTPGLHESKKIFNQFLIQSAIQSLNDCDLIVFVSSVFDSTKEYEKFLMLKPKMPHIIVLNKVDLASNSTLLEKLNEYTHFSEYFQAIIPYSCKKKSYKMPLLNELCKYLPKHPHYYDSQLLSSNTQKELFKDFILESIYENVNDELPYTSEVIIQNISDQYRILKIEAKIITDTKSHKSILIGKEGTTLHRIGKAARFKITQLAQQKTFLKLFVAVHKNWQKDETFLKTLYE
ncbi:GTPase Era [Campylobacter sp. MIT 21-1685]|uniref:GTPase Era n=1 Tax=unclassified Campylobacter TaxID=2593542 RepID=UPI00224B650A|nr:MULTISPECIES: GTPase Era [unclassified Campylobacter]MCX2683131.1 GTPase Era [Campylobacter sp. MIT 21-1684]MCX2751409.1 GTPase Era [Campylobacter sp. MIT 21-1682]MCX2807609.1 GTPase Era [Campylobacter sp. MIT 21-1685]